MKVIKKCLIVVSLLALFSCEKESEQNSFEFTKSSVGFSSTDDIDAMSEEIADFHDYFIHLFWDSIYKEGMTCDADFILAMRDIVNDKAKSYPFVFIDKNGFGKYYDDDSFVDLCFDAMKGDTLDLSYVENLYGDKVDVNFALVEREANQAAAHLENLFYTSSTPEEMEAAYENYVEKRLGNMKTQQDYLCLRFYTDMYLSSFTTWCNILYGQNDGTKKSNWWKSAWDKAKQTAKDVWKEVKPIVKADAKGAVTGAMVGLAGGAAGVGGGAVTGACVDSAGKCIDNISR
mgnify:FL=1